jgi:predicted CxxxxCH...CXXCH cytochrome family protein
LNLNDTLTTGTVNCARCTKQEIHIFNAGRTDTMKTLIKIVAAGMLLVAFSCTKKGNEPPPPNNIVITAKNCGSCHLLPPADSGHSYHVVMMGYNCNHCHQGYAVPDTAGNFSVNTALHRNGDTDVVFTSPWNDSGKAAYVKASKQCNNVYCHGAFPQGTPVSIHWNGTDIITCGSCHTLPPADSGHTMHVAWMSYKCSYCHKGYAMDSAAGTFTANSETHVNGKNDVVFTAPWNDSGKAAYDLASKQCNNVYCHGAIPQGTHASIHWNGTDTIKGDCKFCHNLSRAAPGMYAGHYGHSFYGKKVGGVTVLGSNVNFCFNCHGANISDTTYIVGRPYPSTADHINGVFDKGSCRDCHTTNTPPWTNWQEYVTGHPGATPY